MIAFRRKPDDFATSFSTYLDSAFRSCKVLYVVQENFGSSNYRIKKKIAVYTLFQRLWDEQGTRSSLNYWFI